jgi:hypothetical protein
VLRILRPVVGGDAFHRLVFELRNDRIGRGSSISFWQFGDEYAEHSKHYYGVLDAVVVVLVLSGGLLSLVLVCLDSCELDHRGPPLGLSGNQFAEISGRTRNNRAA